MKADYIIKGTVLENTFDRSCEGYVAVSGNRIMESGAGDIPNAFLDGNTEVIDCSGSENFIMPGFHDAHTHIIQGTLTDEGANLRNAWSEEEAAKMLFDEISSKNYDSFWILGGAWDHFKWKDRKMPKKETLDHYFPDRPVFLLNKECHGAWVNSKTLEFFNITKDTPDPSNGEIFRDEHGEPTGYLHEDAALNIIAQIYDVSDFEHMEIVKKFMKRTAALGITSVSDVQIYNVMKYFGSRELEKRGELNVRIHFCPSITEKVDKLKYLKKMFYSEMLQFSGAKGFVDGTPMGYTGLMKSEYKDRPGFYGEATMEFDEMNAIIEELDKNEIRCRLHACGDGAVGWGLDFYENARKKNGPKGLRHTIEHIEVMDLKDAPRFRELGVIASVQPDHMPKYEFSNHPFHAILGEAGNDHAWPFKTIEDAGGTLAFGTDYPIAPLDPLRGLFRAITRCTDDQIPEPAFGMHECLSRQSALRAYTLGSAFCNFREKDLGTLEKGKLADIVVLDKNLLRCDPLEIKNARVITTIVDGRIVYKREE